MVKPTLDRSRSGEEPAWSDWQLRQLLQLASQAPRVDHRVETPIPGQRLLREAETLEGPDGESGASLLSQVLSSATTLDGLRRIKTVARRLSESEALGAGRDGARLLYHLSVAVAACRFGASISTTTAGERRPVYLALADALRGSPVGEVFSEAAGLIEAHPNRSDCA